MNVTPTSLRFIPDNWLEPLALEQIFDPSRPLEVDIGAGKGRFILERSKQHPLTQFLGIERMLARIRRMDRKALRRELFNLRLLRAEAYYAITYLIPTHSVDTYYLFFPDPWPKTRHAEHRLFNPTFMTALHRTMKPGATLHFATDHMPYYLQVRKLLMTDERFNISPHFQPSPKERTDFELMFYESKPIGRISCQTRQ